MGVDQYFIINVEEGVQRDGTPIDTTNYLETEWSRFYTGKPRKMGGYTQISQGNSEIIRSIYPVPKSNSVDFYLGRASSLKYINKVYTGLGGVETDRTPASGFTANDNNIWDFSLIDTVADSFIFAHVSPNALDINGTAEGGIFYGSINATTPLIDTGETASGGIIYAAPYLFKYGNNIQWTDDPFTSPWMPTDNNFNVYGRKVVAAAPNILSTVPSVLFFAPPYLIRATYAPSDLVTDNFDFGVVDSNISLYSAQSIVMYNNLLFWVGNKGQIYMYNGSVSILPNTLNSKYFARTLNYNYRTRIFGINNPEYNELMWCYPQDSNTENNHSIVFNVQTNALFDTPINRSAGCMSADFNYPVMADSEGEIAPSPGSPRNYGLWMHEIGQNKVINGINYAINSTFTTRYFSALEMANSNELLIIKRIEKDFNQVGQMAVQILTKNYPESEVVESELYYFDEDTTKIDVWAQGRYVAFKFISNANDGYFQMGRIAVQYQLGGQRFGSDN